MATSMIKKGGNVLVFAGAHVVAPAAVGAGLVAGVRALAKSDRIFHPGWMVGGAAGGLVTNAGIQLTANYFEKKAVAAAEAEAEAKAQGKATA